MESGNRIERSVADALRDQVPVRGLRGVSIRDVRLRPKQPFDISFELRSGASRVQVMGEIKLEFSPRLLEQIAPWIQRLKSLRRDVSVAVIAPTLSPQSQAFCIQNGIDFMDFAGNVFINVPGSFTLQRSGMRATTARQTGTETQRARNVFSGRSSRILRALLESPRVWTVTQLARELSEETIRFSSLYPNAQIDFKISLGSVSKAIASLEEPLLVRRRGTAILVPEPIRLLEQWAEKYKERYRWRLRSSFQTGNPFGPDAVRINRGLEQLLPGAYAFTGTLAAQTEAPFVDVDVVDVFLLHNENDKKLAGLKSQLSTGASLRAPKLRFVFPYDAGVFMYSRKLGKIPVVSAIQAYLDLYARGGRDLKQAEYLLANSIRRRWDDV